MGQGRGMGCCGRGRRRKQRTINFTPNTKVFKPAGIATSRLEQIELRDDELEAMRLKNIEGLDIIEGADKMGISKSTFARIYNTAVQKVTVALIEGKAIVISAY